jgi:pimeloyl-ACP methyl ester carboxylesterase
VFQPPTRFATTSDGVNIAYLRLGEGLPVVFASNFGGDVHNYRWAGSEQRGLTDRLVALGCEVVRYDARGMGASDREVTDWSLKARVKDLEAILSGIEAQPFVLVGIDQGAPAAIAYAAQHPTAVSRLILLCPWAHGEARYALPALRVAMANVPTDGSAWEIMTSVIGNVVTHFADPERAQRIAESIRTAMSAEGLRAYFKASREIDVRNILDRVTAPTLVLHEPSFPFGSLDLCKDVSSGIPKRTLDGRERPLDHRHIVRRNSAGDPSVPRANPRERRTRLGAHHSIGTGPDAA